MKTALVIDDEVSIHNLLQLMLERIGWEATFATNGQQAIHKLETFEPDLIITDVIMPDMEGIQTLGLIRKEHPDMPVIVMSGDTVGARFLKTAELMGARVTMEKPFTMSELEMAIWMATKKDGEEDGFEFSSQRVNLFNHDSD